MIYRIPVLKYVEVDIDFQRLHDIICQAFIDDDPDWTIEDLDERHELLSDSFRVEGTEYLGSMGIDICDIECMGEDDYDNSIAVIARDFDRWLTKKRHNDINDAEGIFNRNTTSDGITW